ncbi:hypothetical protein HYU94_02690 [Candidatus Daviesbacteria bacterium]|nr:hypothetical protein [Candidatus Daviesbacteria bacterium]
MAERIYPPTECRSFPGFNLEIYWPKNQIFSVPVLVAAGFSSNAESMQLVSHELALAGFIALCPEFKIGYEPRRLGFLPDVDRAKRKAILHTIGDFGPVDVIAHSKGAIEIISVARDYASFRNILLVTPGGVHPNRGFFSVAWNLIMGDFRNHKHKKQLEQEGGVITDLLRVNSKISKAYRKNKTRVILENLTSAAVSIDQYFSELQRRGIKIAIVAQEDDGYFSPDYLNPQGGDIKGVERFVVLPGVHGAMKFVPKSCREIICILKEMIQISH